MRQQIIDPLETFRLVRRRVPGEAHRHDNIGDAAADHLKTLARSHAALNKHFHHRHFTHFAGLEILDHRRRKNVRSLHPGHKKLLCAMGDFRRLGGIAQRQIQHLVMYRLEINIIPDHRRRLRPARRFIPILHALYQLAGQQTHPQRARPNHAPAHFGE